MQVVKRFRLGRRGLRFTVFDNDVLDLRRWIKLKTRHGRRWIPSLNHGVRIPLRAAAQIFSFGFELQIDLEECLAHHGVPPLGGFELTDFGGGLTAIVSVHGRRPGIMFRHTQGEEEISRSTVTLSLHEYQHLRPIEMSVHLLFPHVNLFQLAWISVGW